MGRCHCGTALGIVEHARYVAVPDYSKHAFTVEPEGELVATVALQVNDYVAAIGAYGETVTHDGLAKSIHGDRKLGFHSALNDLNRWAVEVTNLAL